MIISPQGPHGSDWIMCYFRYNSKDNNFRKNAFIGSNICNLTSLNCEGNKRNLLVTQILQCVFLFSKSV